MKKILTVSLFAMMAVSAANADIASTDYVGKQITATAGTLNDLKTTAKGNLVAAINEVDDNIGTVSFTAAGATQGKTNLTEAIAAVDAQVQGMSNNLTENITKNINELVKDVEILNGDAQTVGSVLKSINDHAVNSVTSGTTEGTIKVDGADVAVAGLGSAAYTESSAYAAVAQGSENANKAVITDASGNIKTGTITSGMITDKTIVNADISDNAEIAQSKISGLTAALSGKQATIADLTTIRSGAAAGATALQKEDIGTGTTEGTIKVDGADVAVAGLGSAAYTESSAYAAVAQGSENANKAVITDASGNIKTGTITSGMITDKTIVNADISDNAEIAQSKISGLTAALSGKQATIADLTTIRSGAAAGATALQKDDIATGTTEGTIKVDGAEVAVAGLGSAAYTESGAYATSAQGTKADNAVAKTDIGVGANFTIPDECKAENAVCSLVVRKGVAGWEKVIYR